MPQSGQDYTARRFQSLSTCDDAGYDTELPEQARTELVAPKRPRILGRKTPASLKPPVTWP